MPRIRGFLPLRNVPGEENGVQHGLVKEAVAHPFADDDVNFLNGELDVFDLAADDGDLVLQSVDVYDLLGVLDDAGHVDSVDVGGAGLGREHGEDACTTADVQHDLVLKTKGKG